jgi:peptidoglycan/xylan/chitin deacetylase (PgdA/CDA1 family)
LRSMITRPTILAYHAVGPIDPADDPLRLFLAPEVFAAQMAFLARHRRVVPLADVIDHGFSRGRPAVAITFDDGYRCLIEHALPVLEHHGFPATLFVPTGAVGDRNRWDDPPPTGGEIMTDDELLEVDRRGLSVESHGHRHIHFHTASPADAFDDLSQSADAINALFGRPARYLAYPYGECTPVVIDAATKLGFRAAFTIGTRDQGPYVRARIPVQRGGPDWQFRAQTSGYWPAVRFSRAGEPIRRVARSRRQAAKAKAAGS